MKHKHLTYAQIGWGWKIVIEYNQKHNKMEDVGMHRKQMTTAAAAATGPTGGKKVGGSEECVRIDKVS